MSDEERPIWWCMKCASAGHTLAHTRTCEGKKEYGSKYAWCIDDDFLWEPGDRNNAGITGPRHAPAHLLALLEHGEGRRFLLFDDDGEKYYRGRLVGEYDGDEPLMDFGYPNAGCTRIDLRTEEGWETVVS